jgi:hypothetical protein
MITVMMVDGDDGPEETPCVDPYICSVDLENILRKFT